jgi:MFS superfamily sulfate permease-like transporter
MLVACLHEHVEKWAGQRAGLPPITVTDWFPMKKVSEQFSIALILCLVDFMESTSIAKAVARRHKYEIFVRQEILAMGLANILGSMFSSYTTTGSFSRSAVAADVGAKRQLAGTITGSIFCPICHSLVVPELC